MLCVEYGESVGPKVPWSWDLIICCHHLMIWESFYCCLWLFPFTYLCCIVAILLLIVIYSLFYCCYTIQSCSILFTPVLLICDPYAHFGIAWELVRNTDSPLDLLNHNLHFIMIPGWLLCSFKCEKCLFNPSSLPHIVQVAPLNNKLPKYCHGSHAWF